MEKVCHNGYILLPPYKSLAVAIVLSLVFGFFGLIYASWWGALIFLIVATIISVIPKIGILLFILCWLICPFWAARIVNKHNKKIQESYSCEKSA